MVKGIPYIRIKTSSDRAYDKPDHTYLWGTIVESKRGPVNTPTFVESKEHAKQLFGVNLDPFFDNGGRGLMVIRAGIEDETHKITKGSLDLQAKMDYSMVMEDGAEPTAVSKATETIIKLENNNPGSNKTAVTFTTYPRGGYSIKISTDNFTTINIQGAKTLKKLVDIINKKSYTLTATLTESGQIFDDLMTGKTNPDGTPTKKGQITSITKDGNKIIDILEPAATFAGTDGIYDTVNDCIPNDAEPYYALQAHTNALELFDNIRIAGVFCTRPEPDIQNAYTYHSVKMSTDDVCRWRYAVIGANDADISTVDKNLNPDIEGLLSRALLCDSQYIIYIGQGAYDYDGNYIPAYKMPMYWAGLRSKLSYGISMFGGDTEKVLYSYSYDENENKPLYDVAPLLKGETTVPFEPDTYVALNEGGVVTLKKEYDTVSFREGVTTMQTGNDYGTEESVVNIVKYALDQTYDVCYLYQGKNLVSSLKASLEEAIKVKLNDMQTFDQTLVDVESDNIKAYDVSVIVTPRAGQRVGKIYVNLKITPVYALRQIEASVIVQ